MDSPGATMMHHRFNRPSVLLSFVAALSVAGCDAEDEFERDADEIELEDVEEPSVNPLQPDELNLVSEMPDPLAATNIWSSEMTPQLSHVGDGDVVMLHSYTEGLLGCDSSNVLQVESIVSNTDSFVWKVHRVDIDGDGTDELQFELIDSTGETGIYLKMNGSDDVYCGTIGGVGDAAAWNMGAYYGSGGTHYKRVVTTLENLKQGQCMKISGGIGTGSVCGNITTKMFRIENLTG